MRFSVASFSCVVGLVAGLGALAAGCTTLLGDFSSGTSSDGGLPGTDGQVVAEGGPQDSASPDSTAHDAGDASADTGPVDGSGDADAAPWSPTTLDSEGKLALWLEASASNIVLSSGMVGLWNDLSHNANNASNASGGPTVVTAAVNGHDAVLFAFGGTVLTIDDAASLQLASDQFAIAAVARAPSAGGYFFSKLTTSSSGGGFKTYVSGFGFDVGVEANDAGATVVYPSAFVGPAPGNSVSWSGPGFEDDAYHVVVLRRTNAFNLSVAIDSQPAQSAATSGMDISQAGEDVVFGGVSFGGVLSEINFSIAEMLVIHTSTGIVGDADVASVQTYLKQKYAL